MNSALRIFLFLALAQSGSIYAQSTHYSVVIRGSLSIFDDEKRVCKSVPEGSARIWLETSKEIPVSFDPYTTELDPDCKWVMVGTLDEQQKTNVVLHANYLDYVLVRKRQVVINPADANKHRVIPRCCYGLVLWSKSRARSESYAHGNKKLEELGEVGPKAVDPAKIQRALKDFDEALTFEQHPSVLQSKADLLERAGRSEEAVETLRVLAQLDDERFKSSVMVKRAPYRIVELVAKQARNDKKSWQAVAEEARNWLDLGVKEHRSAILANYMDSIFERTSPEGDYAEAAKEILQSQELLNDWNDLYYERFKDQEAPPSKPYNEVRQGIQKLQVALGRENP